MASMGKTWSDRRYPTLGGFVLMDGKESMEISMTNKTDGNGICQRPLFSIFCAPVVFSSLVAVLVKKSREVTQMVRVKGYGGNGILV